MIGIKIYTVVILACVLGVKSLPAESSLGIVGGDTVNIIDAPYMARYRGMNTHFTCGAAIIHRKYLTTTVRCIDNLAFRRFADYVTVGSDKEDMAGNAYEVGMTLFDRDYFRHPHNQIGVLQLTTSLRFSKTVSPIPLAKKDFVIPDGAMVDVLGFGSTTGVLSHVEDIKDLKYRDIALVAVPAGRLIRIDLKIPDQLQKASLSYISSDKCRGVVDRLPNNMMCAAGDKKGNCFFDEGGPLVYQGMLVGVVAFDHSCGRSDRPSMFVSTSGVYDLLGTNIDNEDL